MDTPKKATQMATPLSKFEDSPVFNYINSLSPIKPVKSLPVTQTFNSLNFSSPPSIFTSPHISAHKETRFLRRNNCLGLSKPEFSSENGNKICRNDGVANDASQLYDNSAELQENFDPRVSMEEVSVEASNDSKFAIELPQALKYDCGSPGCDSNPCNIESNCMTEMASTSVSVVQFVQEASENGASEADVRLQRTCQMEQKNEVTGCEWESLISDAADLLIFNLPNDSEDFKGLMQKSLDSGGRYASVTPRYINGEPIMEMIDPPISNLHRGMLRRCLDFELVTRRKNADGSSNYGSSVILHSDEKFASEDKQLVPLKPGSDSPRCMVPGIGLHLNALAITPQENKNIGIESLSSVRQINPHHEPLTSASTERDIVAVENGVLLAEDASQTSAYLAEEEYNQNSPKKKRRRMENAGENESCKRCNCKKSKCLKLYCECFAAGVYCIEPCSCQDCFNKPIHEDTVLATRKQIESRNPLAFAPKVIRSSDPLPEVGEDTSKTPASARHKRGCNCKKSSCLKKYCECYQGGVGCSINCRCEGCKNTFGRKDGSSSTDPEAEPEDEEMEMCEKSGVDKRFQKTEFLSNEEQNPGSALPTTPLRLSRPLVQLPFSTKCKPPRSLLSIGSSSGFFTGHNYGKPNILRSQPKFEKSLQTAPEDEMPEILRGNCTPCSGIKTSSPNSKRVSPPHTILGSSPSRRSGRKLILQSIPSFPSLTPKH
ncbi:hypothetical protein CICLE_v10004441mg [Citrus x clementina]|uniref:CRC domain-containing protein n=1 Tax=Citrus clementina TaxID=85681 RepID=V4RZD1_CITCL|nr:hypothetical protein CICLE_v10004441mg [Citrus x clementina]